MGFSFAVTQSLLIRELLVAFFGNELSIGLVLGIWLVLEAIGSGILGRWADRWKGAPSSFGTLQVLFALFLPLCLLAANSSRRLVGAIPGEGLGLIPIFWSSFLILAPLGLVDGAMFAFGVRSYVNIIGDEAPAISRVYILEAVGGILGGIVFTFLFIPLLYSVQMVLVLAGLNLLSAASILVASGAAQGRRLSPGLGLVAVLLIAVLALLFSPLAQELQHWATGQQWPGYDLVYSENSAYGNVAVVEREGQYTFFADGIPILNAPVPDVALSEEIVHLPMLFVPEPRRALVLSGGLGGVLQELSKYPLESIDYAELDPLLIEAVQQFATPLTAGELGDPRLGIELVDGRLLVRRMQGETIRPSEQRYDLIIVNLPYPSTLQLNRFYTVEFYQMLRGLLTEEGVVVLGMPGSLSYLSDELRSLNAMAYRTLQEVYPYVRPIPGDLTLWLASPAGELPALGVESLVERWEARGLDTQLVTAPHIRIRLAQSYLDWFWMSLDAGGGVGRELEAIPVAAKLNRDLHPVGLFYGLSYWNALFSPALARVFAVAGRLSLWVLAIPLVGCALLFLAIVKRTGRGKGAIVPIAIAATGFTGMAADLVIIFAFQSLYGHVYHWIALLIAAFMAGVALGALPMSRRTACAQGDRSAFLRLEVALVLFWVLLPAVLFGLYGRASHSLVFTSAQAILFLLNALAGFLIGAQFPLANRLWPMEGDSRREREGVLYASDLVGAFLASILVSVFLIPVLGILATCLLAAILKLCSLLLFAAVGPRA
jgi:spermidine synthase